jgi:hypothetical protein
MKKALTMRPGAYPDGMAGQCPRGRLDATQGWLHRALTGSTTPRRFHRRVTAQLQHQRVHSKPRSGGWEKHLTGGDWWRRIPRGSTIPISSEGRFPRIPTGGVGRGSGGDHSVQASAARVTGDGRSVQVAAAVTLIASELERERRASEGWAGSVWPTQNRAEGLSQAGWADWASRPDGPTGQVGQKGFWQFSFNQNFKFKYYLFSWIQVKFKNSNNIYKKSS